jgi:uncharacterized protein (DUF1697 family)
MSSQLTIAFLRAINIGTRRMKMEALRLPFVQLGLLDVETFIASGNVLFQTPSTPYHILEQQIEQQLKQTFGYEVDTFLRSLDEVVELANYHPFPEALEQPDQAIVAVAFTRHELQEQHSEALAALNNPLDALHTRGRDFYWMRRPPFQQSKLSNARFERLLKQPLTIRNQSTLQNIAKKYYKS